MYLSIIIPAYNEEARLPGTLHKVDSFLSEQAYTFEVLLVENGSSDRTADIAVQFAARHPFFRFMRVGTKSKALAVKHGMLAASGEYRFLCDADLSMPIEELPKFLPPAQEEFDVAIGSREVCGAVRYREPLYRHLMGRAYNVLIQRFLVDGIEDTQCGFKSFSGDAAECLFRMQCMEGLSFDAELLFIARNLGFRIVEVPIKWYFNGDSRVRLMRDSASMIWDIVRIRRNGQVGKYAPNLEFKQTREGRDDIPNPGR